MTQLSDTRTRTSTPRAFALAVITAVVLATVVNTIVAAIAHGAGASHKFPPLQFAAYTSLGLLGILFAAIAWTVIRSKSSAPAQLLSKLVPAVIVVSFIPDILVGVNKSEAHTSWGAVIALMIMHLCVAAIAVASFTKFLPVSDRNVRA
jgi:hypothetical protein